MPVLDGVTSIVYTSNTMSKFDWAERAQEFLLGAVSDSLLADGLLPSLALAGLTGLVGREEVAFANAQR